MSTMKATYCTYISYYALLATYVDTHMLVLRYTYSYTYMSTFECVPPRVRTKWIVLCRSFTSALQILQPDFHLDFSIILCCLLQARYLHLVKILSFLWYVLCTPHPISSTRPYLCTFLWTPNNRLGEDIKYSWNREAWSRWKIIVVKYKSEWKSGSVVVGTLNYRSVFFIP